MPTNPKSLGKKLIDLATDPEQYSTGEAVSQDQILDSGYSPKDLLVLTKSR